MHKNRFLPYKALIIVAIFYAFLLRSGFANATESTPSVSKPAPRHHTNTTTKTPQEPWQLAQASEVWLPEPRAVSLSSQGIPSDAIALFSGENVDHWQAAEGGNAPWLVQNGALVVAPNTGDIKTKISFCDVQLHIEWMTPSRITDKNNNPLEGQARNNSGIFLQEKYEVQIVDSYQNKTYANGQAGAIYKQSIPLVNASYAPSLWQSYDIIFSAPRFNVAKKLVKPAYITVLHNGIVVQNHFEIQGTTTWIGKPTYTPHSCAPLRLQDHGDPVSYRNIWIRKL